MEDKNLEQLCSDLIVAGNSKWSEVSEALASVVSEHGKDAVKDFLIDGESQYMVEQSVNRWVHNRVIETLIRSVSCDANTILSETTSDNVKIFILQSGLYDDITVIDDLALTGSESVQEFCANYCSLPTLRKMKGSKIKAVRRAYYNRLGAVECLDEMLEDKIAEFREAGISLAPFGYPKLNDMTGEIARGPFMALVKKISPEFLPMLLGNRNVKNSWVSRALQDRLDRGV